MKTTLAILALTFCVGAAAKEINLDCKYTTPKGTYPLSVYINTDTGNATAKDGDIKDVGRLATTSTQYAFAVGNLTDPDGLSYTYAIDRQSLDLTITSRVMRTNQEMPGQCRIVQKKNRI